MPLKIKDQSERNITSTRGLHFISLLEEVEKITDVDELKQIIKTLIRENLILSRRTNTALKSLENQNTLIKYLQQTLASMMTRNTMQTNELWAILGSETLRTFDDVSRYQMLILDVANRYACEDSDKRVLEELKNAALTVPYQTVRVARDKCISFLRKLQDKVQENPESQLSIETEDTVQKRKARTSKFQNSRINAFARSRKKHYREMAKRNACASSRKHSFNKSQSSKSESNGRKNLRNAKLANSGEASQSDAKDSQPKKFLNRRKRKVEEINNESCLTPENESSMSVNKSPEGSTKKTRSTYTNSISKSINQTFDLKPLVIKLRDFMTDPSTDNDQYVAQYKQLYVYKDNEESDYEIVDDADFDQRADSSNNSDNQEEDRISTKSHESEDDQEQDSTVSKSPVAEDDNNDESSRNAISNGKKGPCTPPLSPTPDDYNFIRGPRTPSLSPPASRRGPRTPPGAAPTSDSEATDDDGDSSDSSTL